MIVKTFVVGPIQTNCYICICRDAQPGVSCDFRSDAFVIDPGGDFDILKEFITKEKLNVTKIINTHGHADHIEANREIKELTNAELCIHKDDEICLQNPSLNGSSLFAENLVSIKPDRLLEDNDELILGTNVFKVIHTPGHTKGGICLLVNDLLFTGDTLFANGGIGRSDLRGGSFEVLIQSLKKIFSLPDDLTIYPGHGPISILGKEKTENIT